MLVLIPFDLHGFSLWDKLQPRVLFMQMGKKKNNEKKTTTVCPNDGGWNAQRCSSMQTEQPATHGPGLTKWWLKTAECLNCFMFRIKRVSGHLRMQRGQNNRDILRAKGFSRDENNISSSCRGLKDQEGQSYERRGAKWA